MIETFKFKRELNRLLQQARALPELVTEPLVQNWHDKAFAKGFPTFDGEVTAAGKIALLVIYQPSPVRRSTLALCKHLVAIGYAPFIVSNTPLSEVSIKTLRPMTWKVMVRPNVGRDFGAYRDGILTLQQSQIAMDRLFILNDSVWFPINQGDRLLERLEDLDADVAGTVLRQGRKGRFLESYCYLLKSACLKSPAFWQYWTAFRLTSNKYKLIRRGERAHSQALMRAGLVVKGLFTEEAFLAGLRKMSESELAMTLKYAAFPGKRQSRIFHRLLNDQASQGWRDRVLDAISDSLVKNQFYSAFPYAVVRILDYPVLKLSSDPVAKHWRRSFFNAVSDGALGVGTASVLSELRDYVARDFDEVPLMSEEARIKDGLALAQTDRSPRHTRSGQP